MHKALKNLVGKYGNMFCLLAVAIAPVVSQGCHWKFYQPKEPENLEDIIKYKEIH